MKASEGAFYQDFRDCKLHDSSFAALAPGPAQPRTVVCVTDGLGWAEGDFNAVTDTSPLLSRDNICKHCFYVLQFSGHNNLDVGKSRPR